MPRARGCEGQAEGISQEADGALALRLTVDTQLCGVPGREGARLLSGSLSGKSPEELSEERNLKLESLQQFAVISFHILSKYSQVSPILYSQFQFLSFLLKIVFQNEN